MGADHIDRNKLVEENLPLVEHIVLRVAAGFPRHVDREELASAGMMGLVEAAVRFDPSRGTPFARFASRRIRGAVLDLVRGADWAPRSVRHLARQVDEAQQAVAIRSRSAPDDRAVARELGMRKGDVSLLRHQVLRGVVMTLDHLPGSQGRSMVERVSDDSACGPDEVVEQAELRGYVRAAIEHLPERHRLVVIGYYLEGLSFEELAELLAVTPSRVSQLRADAIEMIREGIEAQDSPPTEERPVGRTARRKARYAASIAESSSWRERLMAASDPLVRGVIT